MSMLSSLFYFICRFDYSRTTFPFADFLDDLRFPPAFKIVTGLYVIRQNFLHSEEFRGSV